MKPLLHEAMQVVGTQLLSSKQLAHGNQSGIVPYFSSAFEFARKALAVFSNVQHQHNPIFSFDATMRHFLFLHSFLEKGIFGGFPTKTEPED
jgi:hypothetical protein